MNRTHMLVIVALAVGCSRGTTAGGASTDPLQQLEADTGHSWTVRWRADLHTPALLEGRTTPMASTADDAARAGRAFLRRHGALFAMGDADDLVAEDAGADELGMTHARFGEEIDGRPVWGGELIAHFDSDGALVRVNGRYVPVTTALGDPVKDADEARVIAVGAARQAEPAVDPDAFTTYAPKLYVYPVDAQTVKLAWRVAIDVESDTVAQSLESFVDATDGTLLHAADVTNYLDGSGVGVFGDPQQLVIAQSGASYVLEDTTRGSPPTRTYSAAGRSRLPGLAVRSKDPAHWDEGGSAPGSAVDAHAFVAATWDHFA